MDVQDGGDFLDAEGSWIPACIKYGVPLTRTRFVIARSAATWRSRYHGGVRCPDEIAALRSQ